MILPDRSYYEGNPFFGDLIFTGMKLRFNPPLTPCMAQKHKTYARYDKNILSYFSLSFVVMNRMDIVRPDNTLGDLVKIISKSSRNVYPVVDYKGKLLGILPLSEVRNIMFRPELYNRFKVSQLMISPPALLSSKDSMEKVMSVFESTQAWNLPVIDNGKYMQRASSQLAMTTMTTTATQNNSGTPAQVDTGFGTNANGAADPTIQTPVGDGSWELLLLLSLYVYFKRKRFFGQVFHA